MTYRRIYDLLSKTIEHRGVGNREYILSHDTGYYMSSYIDSVSSREYTGL